MINMQELQIKSKDDEISKKLLQEGNLVTSYEVTKLINSFFEHKVPGLPYFRPIKLTPYKQSDKKDFNSMFREIEEDLLNAYEVYNNQCDYSTVTQSNYDTEMDNIHKEVDMLLLHSEILDEYTKRNVAYNPHIISFSSLGNTNTKNLMRHNIPYTTSEIDFNTSTLRNEIHSTPNDKIDISNARIKIESSNFRVKNGGDVRNICNDNVNKSVDITIEGMSKTYPTLDITVELEENKDMSRVELKGYSLYNTDIRILLSNDGINFLEKEVVQGATHNVFRFNKESVKSFKLLIQKKEHDYSEGENLKFYYVLKNISVYNDKYSNTSVYTSKAINFDTPVGDVVLSPVHSIPPKTDISYFVGVEDKSCDVEWKSIKPGVPLDLKLLYKEEMILNYYTSDLFGAWDFDRAASQFCFYIHQMPKNTNLNSIDIRAGHSQWLLERLNVVPKDDKPSASDYNKTKVTEIAPLDATMMEIKCEKENNYIVMSQYVICEADTIIENRHIKFNKDKEKFNAVVLINGKQVFSKNDKYSFKLKKGENAVQIMFVLNGLNVSNIENIKTISHNFNLMAYSKAIYAGPKMQRIAYSALSKNVSAHSLKYYAIKTVNGEDRIVTKFDPNYILKPTDPVVKEKKDTLSTGDGPAYVIPDIKLNNSEYFRMYVKFKHMLPETKANLTDKDGNSDIRLRVMAKLSTSDISISPTINAIKVVGE